MSRPFSYNDENFTVIGNILFAHIKITKEFNSNDNIIEIPQAIYDRLCNKGNSIVLVSNKDETHDTFKYDSGIKKSPNDGKYYLYTPYMNISKSSIGSYLLAWYFLKDI